MFSLEFSLNLFLLLPFKLNEQLYPAIISSYVLTILI